MNIAGSGRTNKKMCPASAVEKNELFRLARRFHDFRDEEVAKADEARQAKKLDDGCMHPYCPSPSLSLTQHPSDFRASAVEKNEIFGLALSYDNRAVMDGAGSQLHRIYSIYALSRFLGVPYIHTPIQEIPYQGLLNLQKNQRCPHLVSRYNELFTIPSDREIPQNTKVHRLFKFETDLSFLFSLKEGLHKSSELFLLHIGWPYSLINQQPEMLHHAKLVSPFETSPPSPLFKIVIHVRRGDLLITPEGNRMLPNSYYIALALQITDVLSKLHIPFICELHTEVALTTFTVTPEHHDMKHRLQKTVTLTPESNSLEDFDAIPHLKKCINSDPIESLRSMSTADLLIMSRSSFSYVAAMLNKKGIIVYHPFWHATPLAWLDATHHPSFYERLVEACTAWKEENLLVFKGN